MRELLQQAGYWGLAACGALSLWPFRFSRRWKSWNLYLPVAGLLLYGLYEFALPPEVDVRREMAILLPVLFFLWLNGMAKVALLAALQEKAGGSRRRLRRLPQRTWQLLAAVPIAAGCAFWFWKTMP